MQKSASRLMVPFLALMICTGSLATVAQTSKKSSTKSKASTSQKSKKSRYHRLPSYYGKLKLKPEQVEDIYEIRDKFGPKIESLQKELAELKEQESEDIKDVLTRTQVTAFNKLKAAAGKSSSSSSKSSSSRSKSSKK